MNARIPVDYPSKRRLTDSEAKNALRNGPELEWFEPAYQRAAVIADAVHPYGLIRIFTEGGQSVHYDVQFFHSRTDLAWALEAQWTRTSQEPEPGWPRLPYDVVFFAPDEPIRMRGRVELDDEADS